MKFKIEIKCDNAAFGENLADRACEVQRILRQCVQRLEDPEADEWALLDQNGNRVGFARFAGGR